jgi:isoleucyl-tRNA synthetase
MATARETVRLGLAARAAAQIKIRQPLHEAIIVASGREQTAIERLSELVRDELNVRQLRFVVVADELASYTVKPNFRSLGPRFGKQMGGVVAAIAALEAEKIVAAIRGGGQIAISVDGRDHTLSAEDVLVSLAPLEGYGLERGGSPAVALELALDDDLVREGRAREIVHAIQSARKAANLDISDRIALDLAGDAALIEAAREHAPYVAGETLATSVSYGERSLAHSETVTLDGLTLTISLEIAGDA